MFMDRAAIMQKYETKLLKIGHAQTVITPYANEELIVGQSKFNFTFLQHRLIIAGIRAC